MFDSLFGSGEDRDKTADSKIVDAVVSDVPRKRGRPRKNRENVDTAEPSSAQPTGAPIDLDFLRSSARSLLSTIDSLWSGHVERSTFAITEDPKFSEMIRSKAEMTEEEKDFGSESIAQVASKYEFLSRYAPEGMLAIFVIGYIGRQSLVIKEIQSIARDMMRQRAQQTVQT